MRISIIGCGWLGMALAKQLIVGGHQVNGSTTTPAKLGQMQAEGIRSFLLKIEVHQLNALAMSDFFDCDVLVITVPPTHVDEYPALTKSIAEIAGIRGIALIIFTSSTSVYGEGNKIVDELSPATPATRSAELIVAAEIALRSHHKLNIHIVRLGGLVGPGRSPARFFKNRDIIPNGLAPVNLIHQADGIGILTELIEGAYQNLTINAVCPHHPTRTGFYTMAARLAGHPTPSFALERQHWKIVKSSYLSPLLGYEFKVSNWYKWLAEAEEL